MPPLRWGFLGGVVVLLLGSVSLFYFRFVKVKMLPFDNKSEFQVIVDMPNGTTLEQTARVPRSCWRDATLEQPRGGESPDLRGHGVAITTSTVWCAITTCAAGSNVADIQVNLLPKERPQTAEPRNRQTGARSGCCRSRSATARASKWRRCRPGPPVLETLVAEVYGPVAGRADRHRAADPGSVGSAPMAWWTSIGTWKTISPNTDCWWTKRRPR